MTIALWLLALIALAEVTTSVRRFMSQRNQSSTNRLQALDEEIKALDEAADALVTEEIEELEAAALAAKQALETVALEAEGAKWARCQHCPELAISCWVCARSGKEGHLPIAMAVEYALVFNENESTRRPTLEMIRNMRKRHGLPERGLS